MKILYINLRFPYPPNRGDKIRAYNFIKHLSQKHSVVFVSFFESAEDIESIKELERFCTQVKVAPFSKSRACLNSMSHVFSKLPLQIRYWHSKEMQRIIDELVAQNDFDLIHAQFFRMAQYITKFKCHPKILDLTDAMSLNLHRRAKLDKGIKYPLIKLEESRTRKYEPEIVKQFDMGIMVSEHDRDYLLSLDGSLRLAVVPMGVDIEYFQPRATDEFQPHILFTGTIDYFPNTDAAWYFYHEIFPHIRRALPDVTFYVVGTNPPKKLKKLESNGDIVVTGRVPDVRPYFRNAAVFVSPMRCGTGTQVKNLEAMAMCVPVVTSSFGAAGTEARAERDMLVADEPREFADKVIQLFKDGKLRQNLIRNGRKLVETKYNWQYLGSLLDEIYEQVCS